MNVLSKHRDRGGTRVATIRCLAMAVVSVAVLASPLLVQSAGQADTGAGLVAATTAPDRGGFNLRPANGAAQGIWSDGTTMWVTDRDDDRLYAYNLADGSRQAQEEFDLTSGNDNPEGIWSDGDHVWVVDREDYRAYAYGIGYGGYVDQANLELARTNLLPRGVWSDGSTMWIADSYEDRFFIYDLENSRDASPRRVLKNPVQRGSLASPQLSDQVVLHRRTPQRSVFQHPPRTIHLDRSNERPTGMWSDGRTMWVVDEIDNCLYAYSLADGSRDRSRDLDLDPENGNAFGIWSDGATVWVSDNGDARIYTYGLPPFTA